MNDATEETALTLAIGIDEVFSAFAVGRLLSSFAAASPDVHLRVERGSALDVTACVLDGKIAIGIGLLPRTRAGMECRNLYSTNFVAVVPRGHPLSARATVRLTDLTNDKLVLLTSRHLQRVFFDEELSRQGLTIKNTLEISHVDEVLSCVREGLGLTVLLKEAIHDREHLDKIPVADLTVAHEIGYYLLPGGSNALVESFIHLVQRTFLKPDVDAS
jgi:DNA-binding transcriptional LysR family regulator